MYVVLHQMIPEDWSPIARRTQQESAVAHRKICRDRFALRTCRAITGALSMTNVQGLEWHPAELAVL